MKTRRWQLLSLDSPLLAGVLLMLLLLLPAPFLLQLRIDNAPATYFPPDSPTVVGELLLRKSFPQDEILLVMFQGPGLYSAAFLTALDGLAADMEKHPLVDRVITLTRMDHIGGGEDEVTVDLLVDPRLLHQETAVERRARVMRDRFAADWLAAREGDAQAMIVRPGRLKDSFEYRQLFQDVQQSLAAAGLADRVGGYAGTVAVTVAQIDSMIRDSLRFIPAIFITGLILVWWLFRDRRMLLLNAVVVAAVVQATVALHLVIDRPYTMISAVTPAFMSALTIALSVHLFNAVHSAARHGYRGWAQIRRARAMVWRPALYTALTTATGLASLALSPVQPVQSFGLTTAAGMLILYGVLIGLVPPLLKPLAAPRTDASIHRLDVAMVRVAAIGLRYPLKVVLGTALMGLPLLAALPYIEVETDLYRFFPEDHWLVQGTRATEQALAGVVPLELVLTAPEGGDLAEPARLRAMLAFQRWAEQLPQVDRSLSLADLVQEMNWAFHAETEDYRRIPDSRAAVRQYLLIYNGRELRELADDDLRVARVLLSLNVHGANALQAVIGRMGEQLGQMDLQGMQWRIAGLGRLFADEEELLVDGLLRSLGAALVLITLLLALLWRSWKAALLCMVPNLAPLLLIFGLMGLLGVWLDVATTMIASVAVGIAVDDTIHLFHGYHSRRARGASPLWAVVRTLRWTGRALSATTLILCVQFFLLASSDFLPTVELGALTAVGLLAALAFDLLLLPALLVLTDGWFRRR